MSHPYDMGNKKSMSVLGPTLSFKGELKAEEELLIQGTVEGSIEHTSNLTIGTEGKVRANVKAEFIAVEGQVKGDLRGTKSVVVKDSADVSGNIFSPTVSLYEGATFNGKIDMSGKEPAASGKTEPKSENQEAVSEKTVKSEDADEAKKAETGKKRASNAA